MPSAAKPTLVLQGGGALGAYELGAARRLYENPAFAPEIVAGVSIGAITAVLLARPAKELKPLEALEKFWKLVAVSGWFLAPPFQEYASALGNPRFFMPRLDIFNLPNWTYIYDTTPLRRTLEQLVDVDALADVTAKPQLLVSATDIAAGQVTYFDSADEPLTLDAILASGSLPPSFPMTKIGDTAYWDGGLFDNTPLGAVLDRLAKLPAAEQRVIYVVNLFPNKAPVPATLAQVFERMSNLQFANRTAEDVKLLRRFNEVGDLIKAIEALPAGHPLRADPAFTAIKARGYITVPDIVEITRPDQVAGFGGSDFSPETIEDRAAEGYAQTDKALKAAAD